MSYRKTLSMKHFRSIFETFLKIVDDIPLIFQNYQIFWEDCPLNISKYLRRLPKTLKDHGRLPRKIRIRSTTTTTTSYLHSHIHRWYIAGKVDLSKGYWNPKRKLGVTTHFPEIIKLQSGKKCWNSIFSKKNCFCRFPFNLPWHIHKSNNKYKKL